MSENTQTIKQSDSQAINKTLAVSQLFFAFFRDRVYTIVGLWNVKSGVAVCECWIYLYICICGYYSDYEPVYRFSPIYEFYFDKPVSVTGTFLATATLNSDGLLFGDVAQWGNLLRGYEAWIQKEKQKIYALWYGNLDDEDFYYDSAGLPAPDIELQGIVMRKAQWLFSILVPEGTTAIPAVEGETFGVQLKPNPAAERVVVAAEVGIRSVEVVDMTGRTFIRRSCDALPLSVTLEVKALPHGIYAVKVDTTQGIATQKLAVE